MRLADCSPMELEYHAGQLLARYVQCIDDDRLEQWPDFFTANAVYSIVARENAERGLSLPTMYCDSRGMLRDRVVSLRKANIYERHGYRHLVSATVLDVPEDGECLRARSNYVVYRTRTNGVTELFSAGVYDDVIVCDGQTLRFAVKTVTFDTNRIDSLLALPL